MVVSDDNFLTQFLTNFVTTALGYE